MLSFCFGGRHRQRPSCCHNFSPNDSLTLGITETRTANVGAWDGIPIDKIVVSYTGIGGTYLGSNPVPATTAIVNITGQWSFPGGYCVLAYDDDLWGPSPFGRKAKRRSRSL